nr:hypothetical protein [uncultured Shinella sp.]
MFRTFAALSAVSLVSLLLVSCDSSSASETGGFFPAPGQESSSIVLARGVDGRSHMAFTGYDGKTKDEIYYGICEGADCGTSLEDWSVATIAFPSAIKLQLAVTPEGNPRLYVVARPPSGETNYNRTYSYGECDTDCAKADNWTITRIAESGDNLISDALTPRVPDRTFALDRKGNPRFVYTDGNYIIEPDHYGAFVMACDGDCTKRKNWTETDLALHVGYSTESFSKPALAVAENGAMGVVAGLYPFDEHGTPLKQGLYYYGCEAACTDKANWRRTFIVQQGGGSIPGPTWDLAFTPKGKPRLALFAGDGTEVEGLAHQLLYAWCNEKCDTEDGWSANAVNPGKGIGEGTDLVLDKDGRPHIAMLTGDGQAALARCTDSCETDAPQWTADLAEEIAVPQKERPQALPFHCDGEVWNGFLPSLSLSENAATIGYDILVEARCLYKDFDEPIPSATFHEIFRGSRIATVSLAGD